MQTTYQQPSQCLLATKTTCWLCYIIVNRNREAYTKPAGTPFHVIEDSRVYPESDEHRLACNARYCVDEVTNSQSKARNVVIIVVLVPCVVHCARIVSTDVLQHTLVLGVSPQ